MSETKFAPGPWWVEFDSDGMETAIKGEGKTVIADGGFSNPEDPDYALIAAAPEMYAMLDRVQDSKCDDVLPNVCEEIRELLAKARGEV